VISVTDLWMRFGAKILFKNVSLQFNPGCRYGLVGANGCGKSTFLKILIGDQTAEKGTISFPSQFSIGALRQDHYLYEEEEILNVVLMGKPKLWEAICQKNCLLKQDHFNQAESDALAKWEKVFAEQEGYAAASEAAKLLEGLGIQGPWHQRPLKLLSGGYKLRVLLAQLFFGKPDILLLDEPTNHLDLFSIKWLEGYLRNFPGTLLVTSHDREFLNGVCTHIADVDYGTIKIYKGHYEAFVQQKLQDREQKEALLEKYDKKRADIQTFVDRFRAKASKARQAQSKARFVEQLTEEMESIDLTPSSRLYPTVRFVPYRPSGVTPLIVKDIAKAFGSKKVLDHISFELERGDRLAIVGPNGVGKSTLLEILTGHLESDRGTYQWGHAVRTAYFPQDHAREVQGEISLLDWLGQWDRTLNQEQLRDILGRVLFSGDTVHQPVHTLSGGETARLILAKMMLLQPNVLIFDEPTNHLDIEAIDELTEALQNFEGTLIFVSHNRYFVSRIANRILEIIPQGMKHFKCTYVEYIEREEKDHLSTSVSLRQRYGQEEKKEGEESNSYEEQKRLRNLRTQLKKRVAQTEEESARLEDQIKALDSKMAAEGFYQLTSRDEQLALAKQKEQLEESLLQTLQAWEEASLELQKSEGV
jgi:ATPase subunit of ABC transporter with duplicated ATPase domains